MDAMAVALALLLFCSCASTANEDVVVNNLLLGPFGQELWELEIRTGGGILAAIALLP
jgi:hypothetical protein